MFYVPIFGLTLRMFCVHLRLCVVLKSPMIIVWLSILPFVWNDCFIYFGFSRVGVCILINVMSSWYIISFNIIKYLSLLPFLPRYPFCLISTAVPTFFLDTICLVSSFTPSLWACVCFAAKVSHLRVACRVNFTTLYLLIGEYSPYTFRVNCLYMRTCYYHFTFCFVIVLYLPCFFALVFLFSVLVWWYSMIFFISSFLRILSLNFCLCLPCLN